VTIGIGHRRDRRLDPFFHEPGRKDVKVSKILSKIRRVFFEKTKENLVEIQAHRFRDRFTSHAVVGGCYAAAHRAT
jgi:hypothetical protein